MLRTFIYTILTTQSAKNRIFLLNNQNIFVPQIDAENYSDTVSAVTFNQRLIEMLAMAKTQHREQSSHVVNFVLTVTVLNFVFTDTQ